VAIDIWKMRTGRKTAQELGLIVQAQVPRNKTLPQAQQLNSGGF
jgi:hypothetical protein